MQLLLKTKLKLRLKSVWYANQIRTQTKLRFEMQYKLISPTQSTLKIELKLNSNSQPKQTQTPNQTPSKRQPD